MIKKMLMASVAAIALAGCYSGRDIEDTRHSLLQPSHNEILKKQNEVYGWSCDQLAQAYWDADRFLASWSNVNWWPWSQDPAIEAVAMKRVTLSRMDDKECPTLNVLRDQAELQRAIEALAE